jgi:hypothetical protein
MLAPISKKTAGLDTEFANNNEISLVFCGANDPVVTIIFETMSLDNKCIQKGREPRNVMLMALPLPMEVDNGEKNRVGVGAEMRDVSVVRYVL